jgi:hypothetical protein
MHAVRSVAVLARSRCSSVRAETTDDLDVSAPRRHGDERVLGNLDDRGGHDYDG